MAFEDAVEAVGKAIEGLGVAVIIAGVAAALSTYGWRLAHPTRRADAYSQVRRHLGRAILLGLELLVAGDIVRSVAVTPTFRSVGVLAVIVLIRSFLSMTLEVETTGAWPWQRRRRGQDVV